KDLFNNLSIPLSGIGVIGIALMFSKFRRNTDIYETMGYSLYPEDCSPAVATYLVNSAINTTTIMATIFDLARKGYILIKDKGKYKKKTSNFKLKKLEKPVDSLLDHEKFLMEWLFDEM